MMVDKNLFLHDLAVVLILKSEGHYLKEWLDYHLMAGVDHFYLYDNESPDNTSEVVKPYLKAGIVDYIPLPGKVIQCGVYNEAFKHFKFQCRYMTFLDGDEFIYPKVDGGGLLMLSTKFYRTMQMRRACQLTGSVSARTVKRRLTTHAASWNVSLVVRRKIGAVQINTSRPLPIRVK